MFLIISLQETSDITLDIFHNQSKLFWNATKREEITKNISPDISAELGFYAWEDRCLNNEILLNETGTGNLSVLLLGNSHALCIIPGLQTALKGIYSNISTFIVGAQTPFKGFKNGIKLPELRKAVKKNKSDIIFLIFKYLNDMDEPGNGLNVENAKIQAMQEMIDFLSKHTKVLFISEMDFEVFSFSSLKWAEDIWRNGWSSDYSIKRKVS
uniref:SGNH domain-containing protein n=1 Tax=Panagrolaimus sp. PS1159 TaxID=55785 RepID=A0AC35GAA6_9BILA